MVEAFLDDVSTVEVLDKRSDVISESLCGSLDLLRSRPELDHLLQGATAIVVAKWLLQILVNDWQDFSLNC